MARLLGTVNAGCGAALCAALASCVGGGQALSAGDADRSLVPGPTPVQEFCGSSAEPRIRLEHPELPPCGNREYNYLEATVAGHQLIALSHEDDPCCTDVPTPGMMLGSHVYLDGESWPVSDPIVLPAPPKNADEASAVLHAELMRMLVVHPSMDKLTIRAGWPAAAPALEKHSVGLEQTAGGWRLKTFALSSEAERGIRCRFLEVWEATLDSTHASAKRLALYSEGSAMGQPCQGDPLPE